MNSDNESLTTALATVGQRATERLAGSMRRLLVKQLSVAFQSRQVTDRDIEDIIDGLAVVVLAEVYARLSKEGSE